MRKNGRSVRAQSILDKKAQDKAFDDLMTSNQKIFAEELEKAALKKYQ